jgi:hypothetical protein
MEPYRQQQGDLSLLLALSQSKALVTLAERATQLRFQHDKSSFDRTGLTVNNRYRKELAPLLGHFQPHYHPSRFHGAIPPLDLD